jgi:hypothetical protein
VNARHPVAVAAIYVSVVIDRPVPEVWAAIEPVERHVDWMADAEAIRFHGEQTRGVGTRFICDTKIGPFRLQDEMEIVEWDPPKVMGVRHRGVVTGTGKFTLQRSVGGGTLFAWEEDLDFPWWLGGRLGKLVGKPVLQGVWRRNLQCLRQQLERTPAS